MVSHLTYHACQACVPVTIDFGERYTAGTIFRPGGVVGFGLVHAFNRNFSTY